MKNPVMKFTNEILGFEARGRWLDGQAWLYANDVCKSLELGRVEKALSRLDDDEWRFLESTLTGSLHKVNGGSRKRLFLVNEYGFYRLVLSSRTEAAKKFQRWICHEVLPQIRRYGYWQDAREGGKITRRAFTDTVAELYQYAVARDEFHHKSDFLYLNYTRLVNKVVGVDEERDKLTAKQLFEIETCEDICTKEIAAGMASSQTQHDIYEACKTKLAAWQSLTK